MSANGLKKGDYDAVPAGAAASRFAALKAGVVDAAIVLPPLNFQATALGFVTLGLAADYVKDVPFTGMAVHRRWATANLPVAKRILAATDKSIAWLADPSHRDEAIELLVKVARSSIEDAEASYDYLRRIEYFEPSLSLKLWRELAETWIGAASGWWGLAPQSQEKGPRTEAATDASMSPNGEQHPFFRLLKQSYLAISDQLLEEACRDTLDPAERLRTYVPRSTVGGRDEPDTVSANQPGSSPQSIRDGRRQRG